MSAFLDLGLSPELVSILPFHLPTPVQADSIPLILGGGDVCVSAETGSGKTAAFGLSCAQIVHEVKAGKCRIPQKRCLPVSDSCEVLPIPDGFFRFPSSSYSSIRGSVPFIASFRVCIRPSTGRLRLGFATDEALTSPVGDHAASFGLSLAYGPDGLSVSLVFAGKQTPLVHAFVQKTHSKELLTVACRIEQDAIAFSIDGVALEETLPLPDALKGPLWAVVSGNDGAECQVFLNEASVGETGEQVKGNRPLCIVVTPTNPLVDQTVKVLSDFCRVLSAPQVTVGGDIVVGTPQKLKNLIQTKKMALDRVLFFVLDEADELIKNDKERVLQFLNEKIKALSRFRVQTLLFSATLKTPEIQRGIKVFCTNPVWVDTNLSDQVVPSTVHHAVIQVHATGSDGCLSDEYLDKVHTHETLQKGMAAEKESQYVKRRKLQLLVELADKMNMDRCMVFCRTNLDCDNLEKYLLSLDKGKVGAERGKEHKYSCCVLAGFREASEKRRNLELFQEGGIRFLICTDVAARGVDIRGLPFLVNMTLPDDCDNYVHRIGRVGRAERMGLALSLVSTVKEKVWFHANCKNRGRDGCSNRNLVNEGGCCVWYDEPSLLKNVEKKVKSSIALFDLKTLTIPGVMDKEKENVSCATNATLSSRTALKLASLRTEKAKVVYGEQKSSQSGKFSLPPAVTDLLAIESKLQQIYLARADFKTEIRTTTTTAKKSRK